MAVSALWSPPRARSTAFFRSMAERGDLNDTVDVQHADVLADRRFRAETRHAFLIRRRLFCEQLYPQRLDVTAWEQTAGT